MEQVYAAIGIIIAISIIVLLFSLPVVMAKKRGRSAGGWLALSFLITPIWTAIILAILGDSKEKICSEIISEIQQTDVNKADVTKGKYTMGNGGFFFLGNDNWRLFGCFNLGCLFCFFRTLRAF